MASYGTTPASAQEQIPVAKAAVVDVNKVLVSSNAWKEAEDKMKQQIQSVRDQIEQRNNSLKEKAEELKRQQAILAPEVFQQKAAALQQEQRQLQREMQVTNGKLNETLQNVRGQLKSLIVKIAVDVASKKGMNIGFDKANVIFFKDSIDITDSVLTEFNAAKIEISTEPVKQN
nr:OmpH family outer membrane protein [Sneathiella limimaris]